MSLASAEEDDFYSQKLGSSKTAPHKVNELFLLRRKEKEFLKEIKCLFTDITHPDLQANTNTFVTHTHTSQQEKSKM